MRTAEQVIREIHSALGDGDKQGLRNTAALLEALQAWPVCPVIHVAGTNGKGSVCAMLSSILSAAGFRVGLYTSPFLQTYRERIRISGVPVSENLLAAYGNETLDAAQKLKETRGIHATPFELGTALAFHTFRQERTDIIVSETGMGGRLDPTNAVPSPAVCAITAIGMDHMQYLGDTPGKIAAEKAGIIKPGVPVVCYPQEDEVRSVICQAAKEKHAPLTMLERKQARICCEDAHFNLADFSLENTEYRNLRISLPGRHQVYNAMTALAAAEELKKQGIRIPEDAVRGGMAKVFWPGRLEWCGNILLDGAHNAQGVSALLEFCTRHMAGKRKILLTGVLRDKLTDTMLQALCRTADTAVTVTPDSPRALPAEELCARMSNEGIRAAAVPDPVEGLAKARELAGGDGVVLAAGSLYLIGELRSALGLKP